MSSNTTSNNQMDEENFPFFSEFISEYCKLGNIVGLHGYLSAVNCHISEYLKAEAIANVLPMVDGKVVLKDESKFSKEDVAKFNTLFTSFNNGIAEDLKNEMLNPIFFIGLLDCEVEEVIKLWAQAFIFGGRLEGKGFLEEGDSEISEIIFPIVLQLSDESDDKLAELADEFDPIEVRKDAANHIEDCLSELYEYIREDKLELEEVDEKLKED